MKDFYCAIANIPNHKEIQAELKNYILKEIPIQEDRLVGFKVISNEQLLRNCVVTRNFFNEKGLKLHHVAINNMKPNMRQYIHSDWIPKNTSDIALLFEIQNCQHTRTKVFKIKVGCENNGIPQSTPVKNVENSTYTHWELKDLEFEKDYDLKFPVLVRISAPHQAENDSIDTTDHRVSITFRFWNSPLDKINFY